MKMTEKHSKCTMLLYMGLISGLFMILGGLLAVFLFDQLVRVIIVSKLPLLPDSEVTEAWIHPPVQPLLKIYYFNMTNPEAYIAGGRPVVEELGPYTYQEKWDREEVEWSDGTSQVGFRMRKSYFYRPDLSSGSMDDKITLPNVPMFAMLNKMRALGPDYLSGANIFLASQDPPQTVFETRTVEEVTWGYQHPLVDVANLILPEGEKLPELYGYFYGKNNSLGGEVEINTGSEDISQLGKVISFDNQTKLNVWSGGDETATECNSILGTDGSMFPPFATPTTRLHIFNADLCRSLPLQYSETVTHHGLDTYRFTPASEAFSHKDLPCFCNGEQGCAPQGLFNVTECQKAPMFLSWPHFYNADPDLLTQVGGLNPNREDHQFEVDILPDLGVGLRAAIRLQINIHLRADGVTQLGNASSVFLPIIWFSDGIEELDDPDTLDLLRSAVTGPKQIRVVLSAVLLALGVTVGLVSLILLLARRRQKVVGNNNKEMVVSYSSGHTENSHT